MLNKRIISFKTINTPHNGTNISTLINDEIIDLGIHDKIFTITLDNASNNNVAIQRLKRFWQINDDHAKLFYIRCCAHILNLIVKDGLKQVDSCSWIRMICIQIYNVISKGLLSNPQQ